MVSCGCPVILKQKRLQVGNETIYNHIFNLPPTMYGPLTPSGDGLSNGNQVVTHDNEKTPVYGMLNRSGYIQALVANINAQAGLTLDMSFLTKGLSVSGTMAYQTNSVNQTTTTQNFERYVRSKDLSKLDFSLLGSDNNTPLSYGKSSTFYYNLNLYANVDYKRRFDDHSISAMGYIFYLQQEKEVSSGSGMLPYKRESLGFTATYGYKDRYFVKADLGYSGSEQFHPDNRYIATPAISGAWVVSDEAFLENWTWLSNLKLRASYGITANDQLGGERFLYLDYIDVSGNEGLKGNPDLMAEKMKKQNYGFDLGLFNELTISFDWYKSLCDNMLVSSAGLVPEYQGTVLSNYPKTNTGKMENHGFEIEATSVDDLKNIFNVELDPALVAGSKVLTNQSGFNWLDKLKDKEGNYILQKDVTNPSKRLLFGTYPVAVMSNKTIKNGATGKVPIYCGNFEEAITLFDREKLTIGISTEAGDLWSKDQTGIKVRERLDCQIVDDMAVYKAEIPADQISEPTKKYRRSELEAMTVDEIKQLATTKSYTITKTKKDEIIEEFITAQKG